MTSRLGSDDRRQRLKKGNMASDTGQGDSQGWWWQKIKNSEIIGTTAGAVLGTVIRPGVGTLIGGYLGALIAGYLLAESDYISYERYLDKQGWVAFGIQRVDVGPEGGTITLQSKANRRINFKNEDVIQLEVPKDAVRRQGAGKMPIRYGILMNGKFKLKAGYKLASPVVYVSYDPKDTTKPFKLRLPHWASDEDVFIATAPQDDNGGGDITFNLKDDMVSSSSRNAAISSVSGSELYAVAVREESKSNFYAIPHEIPINNERGVELSVIIFYASSVWCEILHEHYFPDGNFPYPCPSFKFIDSSIRPRLAKDGGPGWEAQLCGYREIGQDHTAMEFHDIKDGDELEKAVTSKRYPPRFVYKLIWSAEAEAYKQRRQVEVLIKGSNPELSFSCMTFEEPGKGRKERAAEEDSLHTEVKKSTYDPHCVDIFEENKDMFLSCIDAHAIASRLEIEGVIPDTVSHKIQQSAPSVANEVLFLHLRSHSSLETIHKLCDVIISMSGYPNMNKLGRSTKDALTTV